MQNMHHHSSLPDYANSADESVISSRSLPDQSKEVLETMSPQSGKRPIFFAAHDSMNSSHLKSNSQPKSNQTMGSVNQDHEQEDSDDQQNENLIGTMPRH
jgi:hypothetical protein